MFLHEHLERVYIGIAGALAVSGTRATRDLGHNLQDSGHGTQEAGHKIRDTLVWQNTNTGGDELLRKLYFAEKTHNTRAHLLTRQISCWEKFIRHITARHTKYRKSGKHLH